MRLILCMLAACGLNEVAGEGIATGPDGGAPTDAGSTSPDGERTPCEEARFHSDLVWIQANVFDVSCTTGCHGKTPPAAGLTLKAGESRAALVNVESTPNPNW